MSLPTIPVSDLTTASIDGTGAFDVLMRAMKVHIDAEYSSGRLRGPEYATVYLGALEAVMNTSLAFVVAAKKTALEAELLSQQLTNAVTENTVLVATECKLRAEYDNLLNMNIKTTAEIALLNQKKVTEQAQVTAMGVDADSVVGRQKALYQAQSDGFLRDAEQKATKLLVDTWNVRRTTDEATVADATNMLNDATIGRAVSKLLAGVQA